MENSINTAELQVVEIIIKQCYKKIETHKLEAHLYDMFDSKNYENSRALAEEVLGCINEYMYAADDSVINLDFKRGMDELTFWSMRLTKRLSENKEDVNSRIAVELLLDLINEINTCDISLKENLSKLSLVA